MDNNAPENRSDYNTTADIPILNQTKSHYIFQARTILDQSKHHPQYALPLHDSVQFPHVPSPWQQASVKEEEAYKNLKNPCSHNPDHESENDF